MHSHSQQNLHLISLGCTKNLVDSEVMLGQLKSYHLTPELKLADIIIINTCGFIESAKQESIQTILEASANRKKGALLVVSGCLAERYAKELKEEIPEIDIITGVGDYDKIAEMIAQLRSLQSKQVFLADERNERVIIGSSFHAYIKLSEGCNQQCSFCAIPQFKGKLHSRTLNSTLKELENLYNQGFRDFSFIAQDSSSYMRDLGQKDGLRQLIDEIDKLNLPISARIFYLYPSSTSLELIESIATSKSFLPYFDMPIQHISDSMLKIMRRGANKAKHIELLKAMREIPHSFVRTSFVIGHPNEGEAEFAELCEFIQSFDFDRINLFAYSPQEGTAAFTLPNRPDTKTTNKRINALNRIIKSQYKAHNLALVGQEAQIILEGKSEMSAYFYKARLKLWGKDIDGEILINDSEIVDNNNEMISLQEGYYRAKITQCKDNLLFGKVISPL
ncbi:30S ribosomal protein S12 methylthiotransferase RimO [Helicobacter sp. MIT 21-1697]|uniref:30S ribosomal protein S12 methylthiotransferase RimO n=1 Tax=Helicobacter sp. MIT 21-1697 TaxID=2993733 RepID=UPI00224A82A9|nr:30S ribosomal protein S12 methylthiotransferase RimO [Helicobacter sp. MIT 21-1697]MCX2717202.1 30S ribosomal protein S12 methylthiotransferase RimO [Helicobacter sp. MIT 21-1697]